MSDWRLDVRIVQDAVNSFPHTSDFKAAFNSAFKDSLPRFLPSTIKEVVRGTGIWKLTIR